MTEAKQKVVAVVAVVAAVAAISALTVGIIALNSIGISSDDQPITIGGGSLHLHPSTRWAMKEDTSTNPPSYYAEYAYSAGFGEIDYACTTEDGIKNVKLPANPGAAVTFVYKGQGKTHELKFTQTSANVLKLTLTDQSTTPVKSTVFRHLLELGQHGKGNWKLESFSSTGLGANDFSCSTNNGDFYLKFTK
jgi:hypothetical protein